MQKMKYAVRVCVLAGLLTSAVSQVQADFLINGSPIVLSPELSQCVSVAKTALIEQVTERQKACSTVMLSLFDLGYTGENKKAIMAALEHFSSKATKIYLGDESTELLLEETRNRLMSRFRDPDSFMTMYSHAYSAMQKWSGSPEAVRSGVYLLEDVARMLCDSRPTAASSVIQSVEHAKYCLSVHKRLDTIVGRASGEINVLANIIYEDYAPLFSSKEHGDPNKLLCQACGLSDGDYVALLKKSYEIYSKGFVAFIAQLVADGAYDLDRKDDSGETLSDWAKRLELDDVVTGLETLRTI